MNNTIPCTVYRGERQDDTYLYVERAGDFDRVPTELLARLGELVHVMDIELHAERVLARADVETVIRALNEDGFYLQLPPREHIPLSS